MMERIKWISIAVVITLFVVIVLQNLQPTTITILFFNTIEMRLAFMLFGTLGIGYLTGMVVGNPLRFLRRKSS
jgi:uncharacterized integral membrane protein